MFVNLNAEELASIRAALPTAPTTLALRDGETILMLQIDVPGHGLMGVETIVKLADCTLPFDDVLRRAFLPSLMRVYERVKATQALGRGTDEKSQAR
jgi:hypothetical protein